jgi:hypothetical protein
MVGYERALTHVITSALNSKQTSQAVRERQFHPC